MAKKMTPRDEIRQYLLQHVRKYPDNIIELAQNFFGLSRETILGYIREMRKEGLLIVSGSGKQRRHALQQTLEHGFDLDLNFDVKPDYIWRDKVFPFLEQHSVQVLDFCQFGFEELITNVLEFSGASQARLGLHIWPDCIRILVMDNGVGIFNQLSVLPGISHPRQAVLELVKGGLSSRPETHSGLGLFIAMRAFESCAILSRQYHLGFLNGLYETSFTPQFCCPGTGVILQVNTFIEHSVQDVLSEYHIHPQDKNKLESTIIPVTLTLFEGETSFGSEQARRAISGCENIAQIILDFAAIDTIEDDFCLPLQEFGIPERIKPIRMNPKVRHKLQAYVG